MPYRTPRRHAPLPAAAALLLLLGAAAELEAQPRPTPPPARPAAQRAQPADTARRPPRPPAAPDTIIERLLKLEGFVPVEYQGQSAVFESDTRTLRLRGDAEVSRQGDRLTADTIHFYQDRRQVMAVGRPTISGQVQDIQGDTLVYDFDRQRARIRNGRTRVTEGATWLVQGDVIAERDAASDRLYAVDACFTTDERFGACAREGEEMPQYHFQADRIMIVRDKVLVARPARLYFQNVPVFWLPFIVQTLERGRRSGLLVPEFSINDIVQTSSGQRRGIDRVGFYWAMSDYMDAQLYGGWLSSEYTKLSGNFRYNFRRQFFDGYLGYNQFWRSAGNQFTLDTRNRWKPTERTNMDLSILYSSSSDFLRRIETDPFVVNQVLSSNFRVDRRFDWGTVNLSADRRQQISDGTVTMTLPGLSVTTQPITLFPALSRGQGSWYNDANLSLGSINAVRTTTAYDDEERRAPDAERTNLNLSGMQLQLGNLRLSGGTQLTRETQQPFTRVWPDSTRDFGRRDIDRGDWQSALSYQIPLVGSSSISPTVNLSQAFQRDERTEGGYLTAPTRMSFGAGVMTDLYGLFPGVGAYSAIRHKLSPSISYAYSPEVQQTALQDSVFGRFSGRPQNLVSLGLNQTFEAKLRAPRIARTDTTGADSLARRAAPNNPEKVTLLRLTTSPLQYDFQRVSEGLPGLTTRSVTNTIGSDFLAGLTLTFTHDLFDQRDVEARERDRDLGSFSPMLTQFNTGFTLGPDSWLFRRLGLGGAQRTGSPATLPDPMRGTGDDLRTPRGGLGSMGTPSFTNNPQFAGGGGWSLGIDYALSRSRAPSRVDDGMENQTLNARLGMPITPNWSMNWNTSYSITDSEFGAHQLSLVRNLHRWQANFNFNRTPTGVTSFNFLVRLIDLPDLKFEHRERDFGAASRPRAAQ